MEEAIVKYMNDFFQVEIPASISRAELESLLAEKINYLLINDFSSLVYILYRVDVSEQKLKSLLKENPNTDAGKLIASMIIERQLEKIKSRQQWRRDDKNIIDENESW